MRRVWKAGLLLAALALLVLAATPWIDRISPAWLPAVQSLGRAWLLLAAVVVVLSLVSRAWLAAGAAAVAAATALVTILNVSNPPACTAGQARLTVLTLNAYYGEADADELAAAIERHGVDVVTIPEATEKLVAAVNSRLAEPFTVRSGQVSEARDPNGTVILSRFPASRIDVPAGPDPSGDFQQPAMALDVDGTKVVVRAVHPRPPVAASVERWRTGLLELGTWQRAQRGTPLIVAGDFNASAAHAPYRDAKRGMFDTAGLWPRATWPLRRWHPPFTDIDHILVRGLAVRDQGTVDVAGTDHRGVWADLSVCPR